MVMPHSPLRSRSRSRLRLRPANPRGFSLVEMIISIALIGTLAVLATPLLRLPITAWSEASVRADLVQAAQAAEGLLAQDLQAALPGSVRVQQVGARVLVEMLEVRAQGRHRFIGPGAGACVPAGCGGDALQAACADTCFTSLGPLEGNAPVGGADWVVVLGAPPTGNAYFGGNVAVPGGFKTRLVDAVPAAEGQRVRHAAFSFGTLSAERRFYIVAQPITWDCNPGTGKLTRVAGYPIAAVQPLVFFGASSNVVVATGLAGCTLRFVAGTGTSSGTLLANVQLQRSGPGGQGVERFEMVSQFMLPQAR